MPKYVIEREVPDAGKLPEHALQAMSQKSCGVLKGMGPEIQWVQSYVTDDKIYCVYIAPNEELVREHAPPIVVRAPAVPTAELVQLRQQLEQARMGLRVADARSDGLEKQIDALNQKLTESQDELTFFRKAREGKKH